MIDARRILVCSPTNTTGGPEALHQLVHEIRSFGRDAHLCYYPFDQRWECPEAFRKYDAPQTRLRDEADSFVLVPENATGLLKGMRRARIGVWWLSVDNYFPRPAPTLLRRWYDLVKSARHDREPLFRLRRAAHFAQSHYALEFLRRKGFAAGMLSDYLSAEHLAAPLPDPARSREDVVLFNPRKGAMKVRALMDRYPGIRFRPIEAMSAAQVAEALRGAKIFVDFGNHPGKDRPPREAALAGCCVITGRQGSAANAQDVPVPDRYKLDDAGPAYVEEFGPLVQCIFADFPRHAADFTAYRERILAERDVFREEVRRAFVGDEG